jgi:hypothetical protein
MNEKNYPAIALWRKITSWKITFGWKIRRKYLKPMYGKFLALLLILFHIVLITRCNFPILDTVKGAYNRQFHLTPPQEKNISEFPYF